MIRFSNLFYALFVIFFICLCGCLFVCVSKCSLHMIGRQNTLFYHFSINFIYTIITIVKYFIITNWKKTAPLPHPIHSTPLRSNHPSTLFKIEIYLLVWNSVFIFQNKLKYILIFQNRKNTLWQIWKMIRGLKELCSSWSINTMKIIPFVEVILHTK